MAHVAERSAIFAIMSHIRRRNKVAIAHDAAFPKTRPLFVPISFWWVNKAAAAPFSNWTTTRPARRFR
jgi:hypothetical protein